MKQFASRTLMLLLAAFLACGTAVSCGKKEKPNPANPVTKTTESTSPSDSTPSSDSTRPSDTSNEKPTDEKPTTPVNPPAPTVKVSLDRTTLSLPVGEIDTLTATVVGADDPTLTWSSSNPAVASVENGTVTAIAEGTAEITVTLSDGISATCTVTVTASVVPASSVVLDMEQLTLMVGETATLTATVLPDTATDKRVFWRSSNPSVVMVQDGLVTAVGKGTATVTAFTDNGKTATCTITVEEALPSGLNYKLVENDSFYMVTGYFGNAREYIIPPIYDGLRVIGIQEDAFKNNTRLQKITVPTNVEKIGASAFEGCTALKEFIIPKSVTKIEPSTFEGCTSLASIRIHGKIQEVGEKAFAGCSALADVTVEDGVGNIGANAFSDCTMLVKVTIGNDVGNIGEKAFINCTSLRTVTIGNNVGLIGKSAFYKCTSLSAVTIGNGIGDIGESAFAECTALLSVKIGEESADIGEKAFSGCTALQEVTIGDHPGNIGGYAFENCTSLVRFTFGDGIKEIGARAFDSCSALESVELPDSITLVGNGAFRHAKALKSVKLSKNMTQINNITFQYCESLKSISLHEGITEIGNSAFSYCYGLEKLEILGDVTSIGNSAFYHCEKLNEIYYASATVKNYKTNHYTFCRAGLGGEGIKLTVAAGAYVPDGLFEPVEEANRPKITEIVFEDGTEQVTYFAIWSNFTYLKKVTIPRSVKSIPAGMFKGSKKATIVSEDEHYDITWYDNSAFNGEAVDPANYAGEAEWLYPKQEGKPHLITIDRNIEEAGTVSGGGTFAYGTTITLTATTIDHQYDFLGWYEGDTLLSKNERYSFFVSGDRTIIAKWEEHPFTITTERNLEAAGTVSGGGTYPYGTTVTLTATANIGYDFLGWYEGDTLLSKNERYSFFVSGNRTIIAKWEGHPYTVTTERNLEAAGTVSGGGTYPYGTTVTLTATANIGYDFLGWFEGDTLLSKDEQYSFFISGNQTVLAKWEIHRCAVAIESNMKEGGTTEGVGRYTYRSTVTVRAMPNRGYQFVGWYENGTLISEANKYTISEIDSDRNLEARWRVADEYTFDYTETECTITGVTDKTRDNYYIPEYVTRIGDSAFSDCSSLTSITIPNSVMSIGDRAFIGCSSLNQILVAEGNTVYHSAGNCLIETGKKILIAGCKSSVIPTDGSVTSIGDYAFSNSSLTYITIPNSVTSIGESAFSFCGRLTSITISDRLTSISGGAFYNCSSLTNITIPDSVTSIGDGAFFRCSSLTSITIPSSVMSIGCAAFYDCSSLTSIAIGKGVTSIGEGAFYNCSSLTGVYITDLAKWCGISFEDYSANPLNYAHQLYLNGALITDLVIPDSVTSINSWAFSGCSSLTSITIPDSVTSIGSEAFYNCSSLTSIAIGKGVTSIGSGAFSGCSSLTSITIPDSVTSIGGAAFSYCRSLTSITIPNSVTSIGFSAFFDCSSLTSITIPFVGASMDGTSETHFAYIFGGSIYFNYECVPSSLKTVVIRGGESISDRAFYGCSNLTSITIPDGVTSIGYDAFFYCSSLTSITIPNGVTSIGDYTFSGCSSLTSITIPEGVTSIGESAFSGCSSLTSITISEGVTSIGFSAFFDCSSLTSITFNGTIAQWNAIFKYSGWNYNTGSYTVHCTDGDISK